MEGEFWYVIVVEWIEQFKWYIGLFIMWKFYYQWMNFGLIIIRCDYVYIVDVVYEDVWCMMVQWYGLIDGYKLIKFVVYNYRWGLEIEYN